VHLGRSRLGLAAILATLDDAYRIADESDESPRRPTLVDLLGTAIRQLEAANGDWDHGLSARGVHRNLGVALQSLALVDLLAEVVVRDGSGARSPTPAELDLHDRVRQLTAAVRPELVIAEDVTAEFALFDRTPLIETLDDNQTVVVRLPDDEVQSLTDTLLDLMLAVGRMREWFEQRSTARLPADPAARETAMLGVTLARQCLDRGVAALEALSDGDSDAAARDLRAAESALVVCEERLPEDVITLRQLVVDVLHSLER
jgi:hypothetical protein